MRINLSNDDIYVGKTSDYRTRFSQHTRKVVKHACGSCLKCPECVKYKKQARIPFTRWITVPLACAASSEEALSLEKWWIRRLQPSLNTPFTPSWVQKRLLDRKSFRSSTTRPHPRVRVGRGPCDIPKDGDTVRPYSFSKYTDLDGVMWRDARRPFHKALQNKSSISLQVKVGDVDLTNWRNLRARYPFSLIQEDNKNRVILKNYNLPNQPGKEIQLTMTPRELSLDDRNQGQYITNQGLWMPGTGKELEEVLPTASEEKLKIFWEHRTHYNKWIREGGRNQIWREMSRRYKGFTCNPIELKIPRATSINGGELKEKVRQLLSLRSGWPEYLVEWHIRNIKIIRTDGKSIGDILTNVNMPWVPRGRCSCNDILHKLRKAGSVWMPPAVDGHIFFTGREYRGPSKESLNRCAANIPKASTWDLRRAVEAVIKRLPCDTSPKDVNKLMTATDAQEDTWERPFVSTKEVYQTRKLLDGMVIGGLDKNQNELWVACPELYGKTLDKLYNSDTGYKKVTLRKVTAYQRKKHGPTELCKYVLNQEFPKPRPNQIGSERDVINAWSLLYREKGWHQYAKFDRKGSFNTPYCLYKAKNAIDLKERQNKLHKARPIAPQTKHPMKDLLGKAGRAWYFISTQREDHMQFEIPMVSGIPDFIN